MAPSAYRLDELGWLLFERLADTVLEVESGVAPEGWHGSADESRETVVWSDLRVPGSARVLPGPVLVQALWRRRGGGVRRARGDSERSALLLTNAPRAEAPIDGMGVGDSDLVLGSHELSAVLDGNAELRRRLPFVLGLRDLGPLLDPTAVERSHFAVRDAHDLAQVFVATRAHARALEMLARHGFVVLTGPPEVGKTAIARMVALSRLSERWEAHEVGDPEQLRAAFDAERAQVFVVDDAFGSTEYRPDAAERWGLELDRVLRVMDERHWLIWTSRPAPLSAGLRRVRRERGSERFPAPGQVQVDAADLDREEKALILFRHAKAASLGTAAVALLQGSGAAIVDHPHFTPERIRRFVSSRLEPLAGAALLPPEEVAAAVEAELGTPTAQMAASFDALDPEHRALLVALLDSGSGAVPERDLAAALRRHRPEGVGQSPLELVDRLADHFLKVVA